MIKKLIIIKMDFFFKLQVFNNSARDEIKRCGLSLKCKIICSMRDSMILIPLDIKAYISLCHVFGII